MNFYRLSSALVAVCLSVFVAGAQNQQPQTPEEKEKQLLEFVDKEVQRLSSLLDLEYWQEFYVDSTLTHDFKAMTQELEEMQKAKVENRDLYINVQDKWMQQIDDSYQRFDACLTGNAPCHGHTECDSIIMDRGRILAVPQLEANCTDAELIHEAAIGKIAGEQLIKLMTLGLTEAEAEEQIINGFLK